MCSAAAVGVVEGVGGGMTDSETGTPHYERVAGRVGRWMELRDEHAGEINGFLGRALEKGILDAPDNPERFVGKLTDVPQEKRNLEFGRNALAEGHAPDSRLWKDIGEQETMLQVAHDHRISSAFVNWSTDEEKEAKGRFVQNFKRHSKQLNKRGARMESAAEFAVDMEERDQFISFDIKAG